MTELPAGLDGIDRSALLLGAEPESPVPALYSRYGRGKNAKESMRDGPWKLHLYAEPQLYNLTTDLGEATNLASEHPKVIARLSAQAVALRQSTQADRPFPKSPATPQK